MPDPGCRVRLTRPMSSLCKYKANAFSKYKDNYKYKDKHFPERNTPDPSGCLVRLIRPMGAHCAQSHGHQMKREMYLEK